MNPSVQAFFDHATNTVSYIVHDPATKKAAIIDPVLDFTPRNGRIATTSADALLATAKAHGLEIVYLLETHAHADHVTGSWLMHEATGCAIGLAAAVVSFRAF